MLEQEDAFAKKDICSWDEFIVARKELGPGKWVFRGQSSDYRLATSLERALKDYGITDPKEAPGIEDQLIRDFRRRYVGSDRECALNDTLYCLALMQHHGTPTRLLDWTYSPFVAAFFALEAAISSNCVVWCLNLDWCDHEVASRVGTCLMCMRENDKTRNDESFLPLFMKDTPTKFVLHENPLNLHERLIVQKGVFVVPGDVSAGFEENLKSLKDWNNPVSVLKLCFKLKPQDHLDAIEELLRMNVGYETLFPGLGGFARSLKTENCFLS